MVKTIFLILREYWVYRAEISVIQVICIFPFICINRLGSCPNASNGGKKMETSHSENNVQARQTFFQLKKMRRCYFYCPSNSCVGFPIFAHTFLPWTSLQVKMLTKDELMPVFPWGGNLLSYTTNPSCGYGNIRWNLAISIFLFSRKKRKIKQHHSS